MKPGVLIFINWKTPHLVVRAMQTIRATASQPDLLRLVIVDNASGDDSLAVFARELPTAEVVAMPTNSGFAKAVNAGLAQVRDEPFAFVLNTDIEFRNDAIGLLQAALAADPLAVLACPKLLRPDGSIQPSAIPEPRIWWELTNRSLPRHLMRLPAGTVAVPGIVGPCMAVHMERLRQLPDPGLDERFFFFFEETDWCKRITAAGFHVLSVPAAEVMHLQGESANRRPVRARIQFYLSRYKYFHKHCGLAGLAILFLGLWLRLTLDLLLHGLLAGLLFWQARRRDRLAVYAALWWWHARLCRPAWGFEPADWNQPLKSR